MESEKLNSLIEKFLSGTASEAEEQELNEWYRKKNDRDVLWEHDVPNEEQLVRERLLQKVQEQIQPDHIKIQANRTRKISYISTAAACLLMACSFLVYFMWFNNNELSGTVLVSKQQVENRYVLLPDHSKVILRPGAEVKYRYSADQREVYLKGEAYFDVTHNKEKPFLVHAGAITTRVLGTSFNIAAYSADEVVVSVSTGKVAVEDHKQKTLLVLKPNQQIQYKQNQPAIEAKAVETKALISWVKKDMQFTEIPFGKLIASLNRRYLTDIEFENENLKNCLVTGVFDGTESLDTVLGVLTKLAGGSYKWENNKIILSGQGCVN